MMEHEDIFDGFSDRTNDTIDAQRISLEDALKEATAKIDSLEEKQKSLETVIIALREEKDFLEDKFSDLRNEKDVLEDESMCNERGVNDMQERIRQLLNDIFWAEGADGRKDTKAMELIVGNLRQTLKNIINFD